MQIPNSTGGIPPGYIPTTGGNGDDATGGIPPRAEMINLTPQEQLRFSSLLSRASDSGPGHAALFATGRGDGGGGDPGAITGQFGNIAPNEMSTDIYAVMALFQRLSQEMRNANREVRTNEMQAQVSALKNAADEMRNAANLRFAAAIVQGAFQIAGGAMQIAQSSQALGNQMKSASLERQASVDMNASKLETNAAAKQGLRNSAAMLTEQSKHAGALGTHQQTMAGANSQIMSGVGGMIAAGFNLGADHADARRAELDADAKIHETGVQQANEMMQQMMDVIRDIRDKLGSIEQSRLETSRGIARNI